MAQGKRMTDKSIEASARLEQSEQFFYPARRLKITIALLILLLALQGCAMSTAPVSVSQDQVSTQVAQALAANPPKLPTGEYVTLVVPQEVTVIHLVTVTPGPPTSTPLPPTDTPTVTFLPFTATPLTLSVTASATATNSPTPTATLIAADPKASLGDPGWRDTFGSAANWYQFKEEDFTFLIDEHDLVMTAHHANNLVNWDLTHINLQNFYLEFTFKVGKCLLNDSYGMAFRAPDLNNAYLFGITCDGKFSLRRWDDHNQMFLYFVDWKGSQAIKAGPDQSNRLGIWADGGHIGAYINDQLVAEAVDETSLSGRFGPFIASNLTEDFKVYATDVAYWVLP
jgi:hypothetical protein